MKIQAKIKKANKWPDLQNSIGYLNQNEFLMGVNFKGNIKIWLFQKVGTSQHKVLLAEEIGCNNELTFY